MAQHGDRIAPSKRRIRPGVEVPRYTTLMVPTLEALRALGGRASNAELAREVIRILKPSSDIVNHPHGEGGRTELEYQLAWARTYLKKVGLVSNTSNGKWSITSKGAEARHDDLAQLVRGGGRAQNKSSPRHDKVSPQPAHDVPQKNRRADNVRFTFYSSSGQEDWSGSVTLAEQTMTLELAGTDNYRIVGHQTAVGFEGIDESMPRPVIGVRAKWIKLDHRYVGVWNESREYMFCFAVPLSLNSRYGGR